MLLSGFTFGKNLVSLGYPFVEASLQIVNYVDELVFLECYSEDETLFWMKLLQRKFPDKIRIERQPWGEITDSGTSIGTMQTAALRQCKGDYALLYQADEVWSTRSIAIFRNYLERTNLHSYSFDFVHCFENYQVMTSPSEAAYSRAIRCVKNLPGIEAEHDGWQMKGDIHPSLYVHLPDPIYHVGYEAFLPTMRKRINHAKLYPDLEDYQRIAAESAQILLSGVVPSHFLKTTPAYEIPEILLPLVGRLDYAVRQELVL